MNSSNRVLVLVLYSIVLFTTVSAEPGPYQLLQEVFMHVQNSGTCAGAGHRNGCCQGSPTACSVPLQDGFCYCDENCHRTEECCRDIFSINCVATTCANAGLSPGCCNWFQDNCRTSGRCYCDRFCRFFNDCCPDVPQNLRCSRKDTLFQVQGRPISRYPQDMDFQNRMKDNLMREKFFASHMRNRPQNRRVRPPLQQDKQ